MKQPKHPMDNHAIFDQIINPDVIFLLISQQINIDINKQQILSNALQNATHDELNNDTFMWDILIENKLTI